MTTSEVLRAGRELDALVAEKVMEWTEVGMGVDLAGRVNGPYGVNPQTKRGDMQTLEGQILEARRFDDVPEYSTDIGAAWTVVEKLRWDGWMVAVIATHQGNLQACALTRGSAAPFPPKDTVLHSVDWRESFREQAKTAPEAICLAALRAVGHE